MLYHKMTVLQADLRSQGLEDAEIDQIVGDAKSEIYDLVLQEIASAVEEIASVAENMDADEFLAQIRLDGNSGYIRVTTESGQLNFSKPQIQMRDQLLQGGKVGKASIYKRIPVGKNSKPITRERVDISSGLTSLRSRSGSGVSDMAAEMASIFNGNLSKTTVTSQPNPNFNPLTNIKTVTSNQDPTQMWVVPPKIADMTSAVNEVNDSLRFKMDDIIDRVITKYREEGTSRVRNA